ncbi:N-acetylmuramoyl-L-alanine amidase [Helicobacter sp. 12S02634-8]|uniref:N-acetylmuramoyl-L-alanine amidase n=1 Tax=Helicobacter sp. 12S02634-8 TaxID=1476199 RepID=UPI000BA603CC|nr:N-acetylmuramoyl-L-alanine amidase [Helicobacter sp. 12S02634-8]PAF48603.1 N-acetylmuramoyl-L-alanine amidase [Helicobacter sp. 12S02634-8]
MLCFVLLGFSFGSGLKILQIIPFGTSSVRISFNQDISKLSFKEHSLKDFRSFLDIQAVLTIPKKDYRFSNQTQVSIAQNTPQIVRVVIKTSKDSTYQTRIVEKHLYISIIDKLPEPKIKPKTEVRAKTEVKPKTSAIKSTSKSPPAHITPPPPSKQAKQTSQTKQASQAPSKAHTASKAAPKAKEGAFKSKTSSAQVSQNLANKKSQSSAVSKTLPQTSTKSLPSQAPQKHKKYKIVIDPGHGGKDCGAMGVSKVCEKVIVLSVSKFLAQELKKRGYIVYMTRDKDVYINLKERTEFANAKNADLFVSIHANSVPKTSNDSPQGVETYFLSTARSERARKVAELENKDDIDIMNYFSKFSFLNSLNSHRLIASNKLAIDIQFGILRELRKSYQGIVDGGVREGPFWVLAGALMPSVLIEIGYNSNPIEARRIDDKRYQRFLAKGIADGIDGYFAKNY